MTIDFHRKNVCLAHCATTHTIFKSKLYFSYLAIKKKCRTISGIGKMIEGFGKAKILLPEGTQINIKSALYSSSANRNLLSFKL
jgi:hypothetical protein